MDGTADDADHAELPDARTIEPILDSNRWRNPGAERSSPRLLGLRGQSIEFFRDPSSGWFRSVNIAEIR
jgi:hypothetical protein